VHPRIPVRQRRRGGRRVPAIGNPADGYYALQVAAETGGPSGTPLEDGWQQKVEAFADRIPLTLGAPGA
jgi:hypothetical protein